MRGEDFEVSDTAHRRLANQLWPMLQQATPVATIHDGRLQRLQHAAQQTVAGISHVRTEEIGL